MSIFLKAADKTWEIPQLLFDSNSSSWARTAWPPGKQCRQGQGRGVPTRCSGLVMHMWHCNRSWPDIWWDHHLTLSSKELILPWRYSLGSTHSQPESDQKLQLVSSAFILDPWEERSICREKCRGCKHTGGCTAAGNRDKLALESGTEAGSASEL